MNIISTIALYIGYFILLLICFIVITYILYKFKIIDKLEVLYHWYFLHEILVITPTKPLNGNSGIADAFGAVLSAFQPEYQYSWRLRTTKDKKIIWMK